MTIQYYKSGDYYLPNLILEETEAKPIGKYDRMQGCFPVRKLPMLNIENCGIRRRSWSSLKAILK